MGVDNFIVAISTGLTGTIFYAFFPAISKRKGFKEFIGDCIFSFGGCFIIGFIFAFLGRG